MLVFLEEQLQSLKVAFVHDWLTGMRGGEVVLEAISELFPRADLFTLLYVPGKISPQLTTLRRQTSWIQKLPAAESRYRYLLPLMPWTIEKFDLSSYDLIISSSHCVAKGVRRPSHAIHISYVHAPMRYIWDRFEDYFGKGRASFSVRIGAKFFRSFLQKWDRKVSSAERVDLLVANSQYIAEQIRIAYGRHSKVIYPFVDLRRFRVPRNPGRNYLMVTAFAPNKRVDLAIDAFNRLKLPLIIVGSGPEERKLKKLAGSTIDFLGPLKNDSIADLYSRARAFVFPGLDDFGITPLEAMAAGTPVIAYGKGGALETVTPETGLFFVPQTVEALMDAVLKVERHQVQFSEFNCRKRAAHFSKERFQNEMKEAIVQVWIERGKPREQIEEVFPAAGIGHP